MTRKLSYESMTQVEVIGLTVRIWGREEEPRFGPRPDIMRAVRSILFTDCPSWRDIYEMLKDVDNVAAFEIKDRNGHGLVTYVDWPE